MACKVMCVQGVSSFSLFLGCMLPAHCWESRWVGEVTQEHTTHFITMFCSRETLRIKRLSTWWNRYIHKQSKDRLPWATSIKNKTYLPSPCPPYRQWVHGFHSRQLSPLLFLPALLQGRRVQDFGFPGRNPFLSTAGIHEHCRDCLTVSLHHPLPLSGSATALSAVRSLQSVFNVLLSPVPNPSGSFSP